MFNNKKVLIVLALGLGGMFWAVFTAYQKKSKLDVIFVEGKELLKEVQTQANVSKKGEEKIDTHHSQKLALYFVKILDCIETGTCVDPPDAHQSFYDITKTKAHEYLKETLESYLENSSLGLPETHQLMRSLSVPNAQVQILGAQLLIRKKLTFEESKEFLEKVENFEEDSFFIVSMLYLELSKRQKFEFINRDQYLAAMASWLKEPIHSPIGLIEEIRQLNLTSEEKRLLAGSLCRFVTQPELEHVRSLVESEISLSVCR